MIDKVCHTLQKTFTFDKVAYYGTRKINRPEVEVELRYHDDGKVTLSVCGTLWNSKHTDAVMCGQCLDEFMDYDSLASNPTFVKLHKMWKKWHLNDMHPGSRSQEDALIARFGHVPNYDTSCTYLKEINLYEDENGYTYGSAWKYWPIASDDLSLLESMLEG